MALVLDGKTFAEATWSSRWASRDGGQTVHWALSRLTSSEQGVDPVLPVLGRAPRCFPAASGDRSGGKGLRAAVRKAFTCALVQRCQWHKRENVLSYLAKREPVWRQRLQLAYNRPEYGGPRRPPVAPA